jgi:hypothetical protein
MPWGLIRPVAKPMNRRINREMDKTILSVSDFTVRSLLPLSRIRKIKPEAREIRMVTNSKMMAILNIAAPLISIHMWLISASISCFHGLRSLFCRPG